MSNLREKMVELYSLEQISQNNTVIHKWHPLTKIVITMVYIVCVMAHGKYALFSLEPFLFYPVLMVTFGELPIKMILKRVLIALPFGLFAGISNLLFERIPVFWIGGFGITNGMLAFLTIFARIFLCVSAILILVGVTPFWKITMQLRSMKFPELFLVLLEMIYRYIGILLEEADTMLIAYRLRSPNGRWPAIYDAGSFIGQLFLRSYSRAERIFQAMQCRGYGNGSIMLQNEPFTLKDAMQTVIICGIHIVITILD